jgi:outer membrane protein assembly factor BamB
MGIFALIAALTGCYLSHERPRGDAGSDAGAPATECPSRAGPYAATLALPADPPSLRFAVSTSAAHSFEPVAAPFGFVAALDENGSDTAVVPTVITAFDRDGALRWRWDGGSAVAPPLVSDGGAIWTARTATLVALDEVGRVVVEHAVSGGERPSVWPIGIDTDGTILVAVTDFAGRTSALAGFDPCDGERWRIPLEDPVFGPAAVTPAGDVYVAAGERVHLVEDGRIVAAHDAGAFINGGPKYVSTGEVIVTSVVGTGVDDATSATRILAVRREDARALDVPGRWSPGRNPIANLPSRTAVVRGWENLVAVDLERGAERWRSWTHPNIILELAASQDDRVLVVSQSFSLFTADGDRLWQIEPPVPTHCVDGLAYDRGLLAASQCDGSFFALGW